MVTPANPTTFIGYSTIQGLKPLYNQDVVNQDLLNQINTEKGTKVMDPEFGCIVWDKLFELKNDSVISDVIADLTRIVNSDPRVTLQQIQLIEQPYGYVGLINLFYNQLYTSGQLTVNFNTQIANSGGNTTGS